MAREHYWKDRAQIKRMMSKVSRGAVQEESEVDIGSPLRCLLTTLEGVEVVESPRTYLPEDAMLHYAPRDVAGNPVSLKQGDTLEMQYAINWAGTPRGRFKVTGDIRPNRRGTELVSYSVSVRRDTEH